MTLPLPANLREYKEWLEELARECGEMVEAGNRLVEKGKIKSDSFELADLRLAEGLVRSFKERLK